MKIRFNDEILTFPKQVWSDLMTADRFVHLIGMFNGETYSCVFRNGILVQNFARMNDNEIECVANQIKFVDSYDYVRYDMRKDVF